MDIEVEIDHISVPCKPLGRRKSALETIPSPLAVRPGLGSKQGSSLRMLMQGGGERKKTLSLSLQSRDRHLKVINGTFYLEARPVRFHIYFKDPPLSATTATVVCLYNEEGFELKRTIDTLTKSPALCLLIVADGLEKLSTSMRVYLQHTFNLDQRIFSDSAEDVWGVRGQTFISSHVSVGGCRMYCLLKRYNHRKINSHEWFFMAFAANLKMEFAFTTDCGAIFRDGTVDKLINHLASNPGCVAVTGRQRAMKMKNQRQLGQDPPCKDTFFEGCLRKLQCYDFEIDHVAGKAANCASGLLPCLHGPCAMFRFEDISGRTVEDYFDVWGYAPPNALSLLGANLQLAEDRIPSLLGVLYSGKTSDSVFEAPFEFEAELSVKAFVTQRRRWGNGALASLLFGLMNVYTTILSSHTIKFKVCNLSVLCLQIISQVLTFFTPALFGFLFGATIRAIVAELLTDERAYEAETIFYSLYGLTYGLFVTVHLKRQAPHDTVVSVPFFMIIVVVNATLMILVISMMIYEAFVYGSWPIVATFGAITIWPLLNALISGSGEGFLLMLRSLPVFTLATPTFIAFIPAYNMARLADLTWGNRPTISQPKAVARRKSLAMPGEELDDEPKILEKWLQKQMLGCKVLNLILVSVNLVLMVFLEKILKSFSFLPEIKSSREVAGTYDGALELCVIFSAPWILLLSIGLFFHLFRLVRKLCKLVRVGRGGEAESEAQSLSMIKNSEHSSSSMFQQGTNPMAKAEEKGKTHELPKARKTRGISVWEQYVDADSGFEYYCNIETGETQWEPPPGWKAGGIIEPPPSEKGSEGRSSVIAGGWSQEWNEEYSTYYYWHEETGESTWEKPI